MIIYDVVGVYVDNEGPGIVSQDMKILARNDLHALQQALSESDAEVFYIERYYQD